MERNFSMKKAFLNYRYYVMMIIGFVVILGVFSIPDENLPLMRWTWMLLVSKSIGFGAGYGLYRLVAYWESKNLVPELSKMIAEE